MGRASRRKAERRVQHDTSLILDFGVPVDVRSASVSRDGKVRVATAESEVKPVRSYIQTSYKRPKKSAKVVNRIPTQTLAFHDPNLSLSKYSLVVAVDTNTPIPDDNSVAFSGMIWTQIVPDPPESYRVRIFKETVAEIRNFSAPAERIGWSLMARSVINSPAGDQIAMVVDSHLGLHPAIEERLEPLLGGVYLPENFSLVYASADARQAYLANELLKMCDRNARALAKRVAESDPVTLPPLVAAEASEPFTHIRIWDWIPSPTPQPPGSGAVSCT